jgi:hypothetical protein
MHASAPMHTPKIMAPRAAAVCLIDCNTRQTIVLMVCLFKLVHKNLALGYFFGRDIQQLEIRLGICTTNRHDKTNDAANAQQGMAPATNNTTPRHQHWGTYPALRRKLHVQLLWKLSNTAFPHEYFDNAG